MVMLSSSSGGGGTSSINQNRQLQSDLSQTTSSTKTMMMTKPFQPKTLKESAVCNQPNYYGLSSLSSMVSSEPPTNTTNDDDGNASNDKKTSVLIDSLALVVEAVEQQKQEEESDSTEEYYDIDNDYEEDYDDEESNSMVQLISTAISPTSSNQRCFNGDSDTTRSTTTINNKTSSTKKVTACDNKEYSKKQQQKQLSNANNEKTPPKTRFTAFKYRSISDGVRPVQLPTKVSTQTASAATTTDTSKLIQNNGQPPKSSITRPHSILKSSTNNPHYNQRCTKGFQRYSPALSSSLSFRGLRYPPSSLVSHPYHHQHQNPKQPNRRSRNKSEEIYGNNINISMFKPLCEINGSMDDNNSSDDPFGSFPMVPLLSSSSNPNNPNPQKSVHILTPTKSAEILFDPMKSAASSIIGFKRKDSTKTTLTKSETLNSNLKVSTKPTMIMKPETETLNSNLKVSTKITTKKSNDTSNISIDSEMLLLNDTLDTNGYYSQLIIPEEEDCNEVSVRLAKLPGKITCTPITTITTATLNSAHSTSQPTTDNNDNFRKKLSTFSSTSEPKVSLLQKPQNNPNQMKLSVETFSDSTINKIDNTNTKFDIPELLSSLTNGNHEKIFTVGDGDPDDDYCRQKMALTYNQHDDDNDSECEYYDAVFDDVGVDLGTRTLDCHQRSNGPSSNRVPNNGQHIITNYHHRRPSTKRIHHQNSHKHSYHQLEHPGEDLSVEGGADDNLGPSYFEHCYNDEVNDNNFVIHNNNSHQLHHQNEEEQYFEDYYEDYYDEEDDNPKYCKRCNIWYHHCDPSYPYRCRCRSISGVGGGAVGGANGTANSNTGDGGNGNGGPGATDTMNTNDTQSVYSIHMQKDFRYYFQHPYTRLFIAYFVVFCNFAIFAEDPLSHSQIECSIPVLGNVISFLFTKYPPQPEWQLIKASIGLVSIVFGLFLGKFVVHHILLRRVLRLKMFRDESGTWMIMLLSTFLLCFLFSIVYNITLRSLHPFPYPYVINSRMGISYASFMKIAACGTWLGDFFTAWMITDMMLQDNLYPDWAKQLRAFWHHHTNIRIVVFWSGALVIASVVITIILTDWICWDNINHGFISTTELSRSLLASGILFMDLLIVMQDWDFPHFVCDLNIKLPGLLSPSYTFEFCRKSLKFPAVELKISGKWFNYGIIVFVMMLDLNMWKNQIIYDPEIYGQYVDPVTYRIYTVNTTAGTTLTITEFPNNTNNHNNNETSASCNNRINALNGKSNSISGSSGSALSTTTTSSSSFSTSSLMPCQESNQSFLFQYEYRAKTLNPETNRPLIESDLLVYSRYFDYSAMVKALSFLPIAAGFIFFFSLIYLYGRFPPKTDRSIGGRLKKRRHHHKSSWRRERRNDSHDGYISWPGITVYYPNNPLDVADGDGGGVTFAIPGTDLERQQQQQNITKNNNNNLVMVPVSGGSPTSSNYYHQNLPQFQFYNLSSQHSILPHPGPTSPSSAMVNAAMIINAATNYRLSPSLVASIAAATSASSASLVSFPESSSTVPITQLHPSLGNSIQNGTQSIVMVENGTGNGNKNDSGAPFHRSPSPQPQQLYPFKPITATPSVANLSNFTQTTPAPPPPLSTTSWINPLNIFPFNTLQYATKLVQQQFSTVSTTTTTTTINQQ